MDPTYMDPTWILCGILYGSYMEAASIPYWVLFESCVDAMWNQDGSPVDPKLDPTRFLHGSSLKDMH